MITPEAYRRAQQGAAQACQEQRSMSVVNKGRIARQDSETQLAHCQPHHGC